MQLATYLRVNGVKTLETEEISFCLHTVDSGNLHEYAHSLSCLAIQPIAELEDLRRCLKELAASCLHLSLQGNTSTSSTPVLSSWFG